MKRRQYDVAFKARIVLEALRERKTIAELASHYEVHPAMIAKWKKHAVGSLPELFSDRRDHERQDQQALQEELYRQIGQLTMELDWLKKNLACFPLERKRELIQWDHPRIVVVRRCELAHDYLGVDAEKVWQIIKNNLRLRSTMRSRRFSAGHRSSTIIML